MIIKNNDSTHEQQFLVMSTQNIPEVKFRTGYFWLTRSNIPVFDPFGNERKLVLRGASRLNGSKCRIFLLPKSYFYGLVDHMSKYYEPASTPVPC